MEDGFGIALRVRTVREMRSANLTHFEYDGLQACRADVGVVPGSIRWLNHRPGC